LSRPRDVAVPLPAPVANGMKKISYGGYRFPPEIIQQAIWLYLRFTLSLRDARTYWQNAALRFLMSPFGAGFIHFGPMIAADLRKR
jgi:putative transposase